MALLARLRAYQGDSYQTPLYAVVIGGAAVDLDTGWTVKAQAREGSALVVDWGVTLGTSIIIESVTVDVGGNPVNTTGFRLYLSKTASELLPIGANYSFDVEISHPTFGPEGDPYRVTLLVGTIAITRDITE